MKTQNSIRHHVTGKYYELEQNNGKAKNPEQFYFHIKPHYKATIIKYVYTVSVISILTAEFGSHY